MQIAEGQQEKDAKAPLLKYFHNVALVVINVNQYCVTSSFENEQSAIEVAEIKKHMA